MTPLEIRRLQPTAPTAPLRRIAPTGEEQRDARQRAPRRERDAEPEPAPRDGDGHIDTHV